MKSGPNKSNGSLLEEWDIERRFNGDKILFQLCQSWEIPTILSILYLIMVFGGQSYMKNRSSFKLRSLMFVWSTILAAFSIVGTYRTVVVGLGIWQRGGMHDFICDETYFDAPITRVWTALFTYSKFFEYLDTAFIIFRKHNLIFLHWYHHLTVALFCWLMYGGRFAGGYPFMMLNYVVHACMYSYYAVRAAGYRPPSFVSIGITFLQIVQMVLGCLIMGAVISWANPSACNSSTAHRLSGSLMYFSYLVLFVHFFHNNYLKKRKDISVTTNESAQNEKVSKNGVHQAEANSRNSISNNTYNLRKRNF